MGERAYRIIKIETDKKPLFKIMDSLYDYLDKKDLIKWINNETASIEYKDLEFCLNNFDFEKQEYSKAILTKLLKDEKGNTTVDFRIW